MLTLYTCSSYRTYCYVLIVCLALDFFFYHSFWANLDTLMCLWCLVTTENVTPDDTNKDVYVNLRSSYPGLQFYVHISCKIKKRKILVSFTIIWIQLCHYSRLLSASKGLLNTLMIRLQNELIFSVLLPPWLPPCSLEEPHKELVNISNKVPPVEASGTSRDLWPHFVTGSTTVTQHRHTQTLTVTQGSCSHNIFKSARGLATVWCWMSKNSCRTFYRQHWWKGWFA